MGAAAQRSSAPDQRQRTGAVRVPGRQMDADGGGAAEDHGSGEAASAERRWRRRRCGDGKREENVRVLPAERESERTGLDGEQHAQQSLGGRSEHGFGG